MTTTEATARTITIPEGADDYVSVAFFARAPGAYEQIKAAHPEGIETEIAPERDTDGVWRFTPVWHWSQGSVHCTCHGPKVEVA